MVKPIKQLQVGKNGLTEAFLKQVESFFDKERMVKISVLKSACRDKTELKEMAEKIVAYLGTKFNYKIVGYVITVAKYRKDVR
jgi:RNA-binding protein YhbY